MDDPQLDHFNSLPDGILAQIQARLNFEDCYGRFPQLNHRLLSLTKAFAQVDARVSSFHTDEHIISKIVEIAKAHAMARKCRIRIALCDARIENVQHERQGRFTAVPYGEDPTNDYVNCGLRLIGGGQLAWMTIDARHGPRVPLVPQICDGPLQFANFANLAETFGRRDTPFGRLLVVQGLDDLDKVTLSHEIMHALSVDMREFRFCGSSDVHIIMEENRIPNSTSAVSRLVTLLRCRPACPFRDPPANT